MSYTDPRWQKLRLEVMQRDHWSCVACGRDDQELHVHHIEYRRELWDTPKNLLQTLCHGCHKALGVHKKGGVFYEWTKRWMCECDDGSDGYEEVLNIVYRHCPICGNKDNSSHSGCVIFKCGHNPVENFGSHYVDIVNDSTLCFELNYYKGGGNYTVVNGFPAYGYPAVWVDESRMNTDEFCFVY